LPPTTQLNDENFAFFQAWMHMRFEIYIQFVFAPAAVTSTKAYTSQVLHRNSMDGVFL
jgi:hypothetical protein